MAIIWTKDWTASDDGTVLKAIDLQNIQDDINQTGLADADKIQGVPVAEPTPGDDGKALIYDDAVPEFTYGSLSGLPPGIYLPYGGSSAPAGWQLCDGTAVNRVTFADLFAAIGTAYGVGDGATTFNLPDMRGRGALGIDNMGGVSADVNTDANADIIGGTLGSETVNAEHGHTTGAPDDLILVDDNSGGDDHNVGSDSHGHNIVAGGDAAQSTIDPKLASIWIIKN